MPTNRRRHNNAIPIASLATWVIIGIFACGAGLAYVWCKNQLYSNGTRIKTLERELLELRSKNDVAQSKIATLSSMKMLNTRYKDGFIDLIPITNDRIVQMNSKAGSADDGELRAVSNERHQE